MAKAFNRIEVEGFFIAKNVRLMLPTDACWGNFSQLSNIIVILII